MLFLIASIFRLQTNSAKNAVTSGLLQFNNDIRPWSCSQANGKKSTL